MSDDVTNLPPRLDAALRAMREPPTIAPSTTARVAARAVLANAPAARATTWVLRAAAMLVVVLMGAAGLRAGLRSNERGAREIAVAPVNTQERAGAEAVGSTALRPVVQTAARPIVFELDAPNAHTVQVVGNFNDWSRDASRMERGPDGHWRMTTLLAPGRYVYAYLIDGRRFQRDPLRDAIEDRDFGVTGSELVVGEAPE